MKMVNYLKCGIIFFVIVATAPASLAAVNDKSPDQFIHEMETICETLFKGLRDNKITRKKLNKTINNEHKRLKRELKSVIFYHKKDKVLVKKYRVTMSRINKLHVLNYKKSGIECAIPKYE